MFPKNAGYSVTPPTNSSFLPQPNTCFSTTLHAGGFAKPLIDMIPYILTSFVGINKYTNKQKFNTISTALICSCLDFSLMVGTFSSCICC